MLKLSALRLLILVSSVGFVGCSDGIGAGSAPALARSESTSARQPKDRTPDVFTFVDQANVAISAEITSAPVTITGINKRAVISISGGTYSIGCLSKFAAKQKKIKVGRSVCVRHTAASTAGTATNTTITIGGVADTFTSTTAPPPDVTPPSVVSVSPANGATGVTPLTLVVVTFSEAISNLTAANFTLSGPVGAVAGAVSVSGSVTTFTPAAFLSTNSSYTLRISGAEDLAGNVLATALTSTFTTAPPPDVIAPTVLHTSPVDGAAAVGVGSSISVTFSEPMLSSSITNANFNVTGSNGDVAGVVSVSGAVAMFTPSAGLVGSSSYTLTLNGAADTAGNILGAPVNATFTMVVPRFAYVMDEGRGKIVSYTVNSTTGQLRRVGDAADSGFRGFEMTIHPSGRFAYVIDTTASFLVRTFAINERTGALSQVGVPLVMSAAPRSVTISPSGRFAYFVGGGLLEPGFVAPYSIDDATGALTSIGGPVASMGEAPQRMRILPSGQYAYVPHFWSGGISTFRIDETSGALTNVGVGAGTNLTQGFAYSSIHPFGRFFYAVNGGSSAGVFTFSVDATSGALTYSGERVPDIKARMEFDPSGRFAYGFRDSQPVPTTPSVRYLEAFRFDANTGILTNLGTSLPVDDSLSRNLAIDASGKFVFVVGNRDEVSSFGIDVATGGLTPLARLPALNVTAITLSKAAVPVRYIPKFAYVPNANSNDVAAYSINPTTGALTSLGTPVAAGTGPSSIALDALGEFAYVANAGSGGVSGFVIDPSTGALTSLGAPAPGIAGGVSISIDPLGTEVVVAHQDQDALSYYLRNSNTGVLGQPSVGQLPVGARPSWAGFNESLSSSYLRFYVAHGGLDIISDSYGLEVATGNTPVSVTLLPRHPFAYAVNLGSDDISGYSVAADGRLVGQGNAVPAGVGPRSLAITPSLRFAYVANSISNDVSAYRIDAATGALTSLGAAIPAGLNPCCVSVDISGEFAFVVNTGSNDISVYSINPTTGALTSVGTALSAGSGPAGIVTTGTYE